MSTRRIIWTVSLVLGLGPAVLAATYSGQITSTQGEVSGVGLWINPGPTTLQWEVTDHGSYFHYKYTLSVPQRDVSHLILEVSPTFEAANFWNASGPFNGTEIHDFTQANGNPNIPGTLHGLKFDNMSGLSPVIEFDSNRRPVWGDFYSKGGGNPAAQVWNEGFLRADPLDPPANGSLDRHVLVPDSVIPEPGGTGLLAVGVLLASYCRR
ncbi:MAG: hypothetical protein AB1716_01810 [Planctomycetota bacterium]